MQSKVEGADGPFERQLELPRHSLTLHAQKGIETEKTRATGKSRVKAGKLGLRRPSCAVIGHKIVSRITSFR